MMKLKTLSLKVILALAAVVIGMFALMLFWRLPATLMRDYHHAGSAWVMTIGIYVTVLCFFGAIGYAWQLLRRVDTNTAFSWVAVKNLRHLKWATTGMTIGLIGIMPEFYVMAQFEDAPGLCLIGSGIVALPLMVTIFLAVLQELWTKALMYKAENDLTI
ncbi:DUF2975 domain-containing protein [Lacticaseibacillus porcinae]|uniref:DUF2975 domain-containing protein n=1 Tax=Lacticaseibacillus porcinae TaxID=1123687 RepID=UPI000F7A9F3B|nr:DUF2975 domain-containing protein [Lacticaseibacillus porcinae]